MNDIITIREAVARAKKESLPVSEYALRKWVKNGEIPSRHAGNKTLLYYPNIIQFLHCEPFSDTNK